VDMDFRMRCSDHRSMRHDVGKHVVLCDFNCKMRVATPKWLVSESTKLGSVGL
jgi:hypothetical protein